MNSVNALNFSRCSGVTGEAASSYCGSRAALAARFLGLFPALQIVIDLLQNIFRNIDRNASAHR